MADSQDQNSEEQEEKKGGGMMIFVILLVVALIAGGSTPFVLSSFASSEGEEEVAEVEEPEDDEPKSYAYIPFEDVTANVKTESLKRFVHVKASFKVEKEHEADVTKLVEDHELVLKNWLLFYLQQHEIHDLTGAANFNRIRREIRENVNHLLFEGKDELIEDVLFGEFNIQ